MFGQLTHAKNQLMQQFSGQFEIYNGYLVYRKNSIDPPIRVDKAEQDLWTGEFESSLPREFYRGISIILISMFAMIIFDIAVLNIPNWLPLVLIIPIIMYFAIDLRRGITRPAVELAKANRAPMSDVKNKEDTQKTAYKNLTWSTVIIPIFIFFAFLAIVPFIKAEFYANYPWAIGTYAFVMTTLFFLSILNAIKKWKIEKED